MLSRVYSSHIVGLDAHIVAVEVDVNRRGFPLFRVVGMAHKSVVEAKERVRAALRYCDLSVKAAKTTVNLSPANQIKKGTSFDLPIAVGLLMSHNRFIGRSNAMFIGELGMNGDLIPIRGVTAMILKAKERGLTEIYIPKGNTGDADYIDGIKVIPVKNIKELFYHLAGKKAIEHLSVKKYTSETHNNYSKLKSIVGQEHGLRAAEIAAAGGHHILFSGPPGNGKSLLAQAIAEILPALTKDEYIDVMKITSMHSSQKKRYSRPVVQPSHSITRQKLVGGGHSYGILAEAHRGLFILDELPDYSSHVIEALRKPLEEKQYMLHIADKSIAVPSDFQLVGTSNRCPCGYLGHTTKECVCSQQVIQNYIRKISGPIHDRLDMHVFIADQPGEKTLSDTRIQEMRQRISIARQIQYTRYRGKHVCNANLSFSDIKKFLKLDVKTQEIADTASKNLILSRRSFTKMILVAQTIADLEESETIQQKHILESLQFVHRG